MRLTPKSRSLLIISVIDAWVLGGLTLARISLGPTAVPSLVLAASCVVVFVFTFIWVLTLLRRLKRSALAKTDAPRRSCALVAVAAIYIFGAIQGLVEIIRGELPLWALAVIPLVGLAAWYFFINSAKYDGAMK